MEVEREITDMQATISDLLADIRELRQEIASLKTWTSAIASRPDPNRVIGPRPGQPPSPGWKNRDHTVYPMDRKWLTPFEYPDPLGSDDDFHDR